MPNKLFCFGLGYSATHFINHLKDQDTGWQFAGTKRAATEYPEAHITSHIFDGNRPMTHAVEKLSDVSHMLISIAPQENIGDPVLRHHAAEISKLKNLKWLGLLSTTGIYGDRGGDWVDDNSLPAPASAKGRQRLAAEQSWLQMLHDHQIPIHIFRLGSIYGPDKGPLPNLLAGRVKKIIKPKHYFSRIHVADIAQVLSASMNAPNPGRTYNVVDDMPAESSEVIDYICDLLGRPPLPPLGLAEAEMSPMMKIFYSENKRVRNDRLKQELGITLKYPTYKKGFSALTRDL